MMYNTHIDNIIILIFKGEYNERMIEKQDIPVVHGTTDELANEWTYNAFRNAIKKIETRWGLEHANF